MDGYLAQTGLPSWNFSFADDQGSIGYRATGRIFRPAQRNNFSILTQTLAEVENDPEFSAPLTSDEMPHLLNPDRGYIATANNNHWPLEAPLQSGRAPYTGFRAFRIEELLQATPQHDLESNRKIQCDVQAVDARFLVPQLITNLASAAPFQFNEKETSALNLLKSWNFETDVQCVACGIYRAWVNILYTTQKLNSMSLFRTLNSNPSPEWKNQLVSAFQESVAQLTNKGKKPFPKWGELHLNYFRHLADPEFQKIAPIGTPGDEHTVNPGSENNKENPFEHTDGASQRLIVEMTSPPRVYSILPGTNVDLPAQDLNDPHSPWQDWAQCRMKKRNFPVDWTTLPAKTTFKL
jgi:penicillin amidase